MARPATPGTWSKLSSRRLLFILIALNVIWSPVNWGVRVLTTHGTTPVAAATLRWSVLGACFWAALAIPWVRRQFKVVFPVWRDAMLCVLAGALLAGPSHALYYTALKTASTSVCAAINCTGPLWTTLLALVILRERARTARLIAVGAGIVGAYVISIGFGLPVMSDGTTAANLLYLCATLMECVAFVVITSVLRRSSAVGAFAFQLLGNSLALFLLPMLFPSAMPFRIQPVGIEFWLPMLYLIFGAGLIAWGGWYWLAERTPVSTMLATLGIQAPIAAWIGFQALHEPLNGGFWVGATLIMLGLGLAAWDARSDHESPMNPEIFEPS